jgi:hypothetical protein
LIAVVQILGGGLLGILAGSLLGSQAVFSLFFGVPFSRKLLREGKLLNRLPLRYYTGAAFVFVGLLLAATWIVWRFMPFTFFLGFVVGAGLVVVRASARARMRGTNVRDYVRLFRNHLTQDFLAQTEE